MQREKLAEAFLSRTPIAGVMFEHNDYVKVVSGAHSEKFGSLVSLLELTPEPRFVVELESGFDVEVLQSELASVCN
ncbi:hypothetical protein [Collimonas sp. PA-H2]|jgi:hypothetical protein|uniref:hypothetical protein n=1 Tax=Collimonas sp. PA-H2 TaxID=1881062 RepID=UPI00117E54B8|nr:hypothetical protein [Collimonas sp. PA-H2]